MTQHTELKILETCENIAALLIEKNRNYGDSALHPIKCFSKTDAATSLLQRLDDKISRIMNSDELRRNDVSDLMGYLILLSISKGWEGAVECD